MFNDIVHWSMAKIKQFFFISWSIHILWSQDKSALKNIVKDAPDICAAPFSKMITYVLIRHQKFITQRKTSMSKVIFTSRNIQVMFSCIFINVCIRRWSFPSCNCINKMKSKVTTKKAVLETKSLSILKKQPFKCRGCTMNMTSIYRTDGILEKWPEFWVIVDLRWYWIVCSWQADICHVKGWGWENYKHFSKVSRRLWRNIIKDKIVTHCEIILLDLWNHSPVWQIVNPVTQVYKKIDSCSSSDTNLELVWPSLQSSEISSKNTCWSTPSSQQIHSRWPVSTPTPSLHPLRLMYGMVLAL